MRIKPYNQTLEGSISLENNDIILKDNYNNIKSLIKGHLGIQISEDGRVWICINSIAFIRFKPKGDNK